MIAEQPSKLILRGDLWTLVRVSFPLFLFLLCETLTAFCERIFLSYQGTEAVFSSLNGSYLACVFQLPCLVIASMTQVFVGLYQGRGELKQIGPCVWQMIWFSLLSLVITLPLSFWSSSFYFKGTFMEQMGNDYFKILALGNFLFPLNLALTSFYLGRGKTILVTLLLLASYAFNLGICWLLIFGIRGVLSPLGIQGAALAKCLSLGLFCLVFFVLFLNRKNREIYGTNEWRLSPITLWSYLRPGIVRALGYFWIRAGWGTISYIMIKKGGLYLEVLTVGGLVGSLFTFIFTGLYRSVLTTASNLLGRKDYSGLWQLCRSLIIYICIIGLVMAVPLLLYPQSLICFFDSSSQQLFERTFKIINHWVWFYSVAAAIQMGLVGFVVVMQNLRVQFCAAFFTVLTSLLPVYLCMELCEWGADKLWLIMALENVFYALIFFYYIRKKRWEDKQVTLQNEPI
jgi:MATE family multidrug resistance protein